MNLVELSLYGIAALALLPTVIVLAQVVSALFAQRGPQQKGLQRPRVAVLIPAHDEEALISKTLTSIRHQLAPGDRLLVVADNCTDNTANIAASIGAEVIVRNDRTLVGKSYALDFGIRFLRTNPPEIVICIDADCEVSSGTVDRLAHVCAETMRPVQALYLMRSPQEATPLVKLAEFAWLVKNCVRPLGYCRLGLPCQLMGTGMAFPWPLISTADLAGDEIVEDLVLGLKLANSGKPPVFCPEASVTSSLPNSDDARRVQRTRWEHGHLGVITAYARRLAVEAILKRDFQLLALVLDLCVPPLALLTVFVLSAFSVNLLFFLLTSKAYPMWLSTVALVGLMSSISLAWLRYGRSVIPFGALALAPIYALGKIPLYLGFAARRERRWIRTKRNER